MATNIEIRRYSSGVWGTVYPKANWNNMDNKPSTFTPSSHTHTVAQISDLASWAKASSKPSYSASEISGVSPPINNARSNLGDPTVYETGIVDSEFTNKTMAYSPDYVKIYRSNDGTTLTEATEYTNDHKKKLLVGDGQTQLSIPVNTYLVIEITSMSYVYLNMLYTYNSTSGSRFEYRIDVSYNKTSWNTWVNYGTQQSTWPGHTVLRHDTIPFMQNGTQGIHYGAVRVWIKCVKVSESYSTSYLYKLQWWGGYPVGRRTYYSVDENQNHTFPTGVLASTFYEDGTSLSNKYLKLSGGTLTGMLTVKSPIFAYEYNVNTNNAAIIMDKPGSNYTGIGSHGETDTIYFGACGSTGGWVDTYKQKWKFNGTIYENGTSLADKYQAKGTYLTSHQDISGKADKASITAGWYRRVQVNAQGIVIGGDQTDANDDTNTWRKVQLNGVDKLGNGISTNPLNIKAGSNVTITESSGTFTFAATDTTYESKSAASGGTAVSLVTTGEKYTWNNKATINDVNNAIQAAIGDAIAASY